MNIQNLRYFAIVAKLENVSKTAELMHTTQSAVSKNISTLEEELGIRLFDRMGKRLILNDAGRRFLQSCERILEETDTATKDLRHMSSGGDNIIRICAASMDPHLFSCMHMFKLAYSNVEYRIDTLEDRYELPDINEYDVIIYPDEIRFRKFKGFDFTAEKYYFAVRTDHPLAERISIPVRMMDGLPFVFLRHKMEYEYPFHVCLAQNVSMDHINCVDARDHHRQMIANGIAVGFVPEGNAEMYRQDKRIKLLYLTDDRFTRAMKVCFKREKHLSGLAGAFKEYFMGYFNLKSESIQSSDL
ncbi:MAG: LysR family transcriptional regulator [Mogibacterium sp.]|nr:LysR family transcriptional regulator [Mogibacterium sp.]